MDAPTWTPASRPARDWRAVDRALRQIAVRRAGLDADEARWLREAEALQIWRPLGMVSMIDYLERVLGYAPRTAQDRLRVARALGDLPQLTAALSAGKLAFSAVRELSRVATPATEAQWLAAATGKSLRQIEELVADHRPGDRPDDPPDPSARIHVVRFELGPETFALMRQARMILDDEHHTNLSDNAFIAALCHAVLDGAPQAESSGRAKYQVAVTLCRRCQQGWQEGAGAQIPIDAAAVERALCDAQHIGSLDGAAPERAYQDIPPSVARLVWRRDGGRCRIPGCRSSRGLELHHIRHRADGGTHDPQNIVIACSSCHLAHHRGLLTISGTAERLEVHRPGDARHDTSSHATRSGASRTAARDPASSPMLASSPKAAASARPLTTGAKPLSAASVDSTVPLPSLPMRTQTDAVHAPPADELGAHVGAPTAGPSGGKLAAAMLRAQAKAALTGLGWKPAIAQAAIAAAAAQCGEVTLEQLIVQALRRCPVPKA